MNGNRATAGRPVLVTGASSGIGLEISALLAGAGFRVLAGVLPGEDTAALDETDAEIVALDVTDRTSLAAAGAAVAESLGDTPLWGLVNNAGVVAAGPIELLDLAEARHVFEVNVLGVLAATQTFLPFLRAARGRIINLSSLSGLLAVPFLGPYSASKAAIESLSDTLRRELHTFGVDVIVIQPGVTRTPLWQKADQIDLSPYRGSPYQAAVERVQRKAVKKGNRGMPPAHVAGAVLRALTAARPPTRIRVQRRRAASLRYGLLPLIPDRILDRMVARRVWRE